jgi:hypothetical protein
MIKAGDRALAVATLVTWLITDSLGGYMLKSWISSGAARRRPAQSGGMSLPVLLGHAGLAFTGLVCWLSFLVSSAPVAGLLAIGLLAPAIGLGISTVTVWTPYPVRRDSSPVGQRDDGSPGVLPDELVERALDDEELTSRLVDDLLDRNLTGSAAEGRTPRADLRAIVPLAHGLLAITTFLLATLALVAAL